MAKRMDEREISRRALLARGGLLLGGSLIGRAAAAEKETVPKYLSQEAAVKPYELPDPLKRTDGSKVTTADEWRGKQRETVLELFRAHVYGRSPGRPEKLSFEVTKKDPEAIGGTATLKRVAIRCGQAGRTHEFELLVFLPHGRPKAPVFLLLNNRPAENTDPTRAMKSGFWPVEEVLARGYGIAAIQVNEVGPDKKETFRHGVIQLMEGDRTERPPDAWKTISAWAWGASRALDYLVTDPDVDGKRVAVVGHSRGGKTALWAGAQDERFALSVSNCSGCTGAALSRRPVGETVKVINNAFPHWFCDNYRKYNDREAELPIDQHELIALVAPRPVYVASAVEDVWADPKGEFQALAHATPVYRLFGEPAIDPEAMPAVEQPFIAGHRAYHIRPGIHNLTPYDWQRYLDFTDRLGWKA